MKSARTYVLNVFIMYGNTQLNEIYKFLALKALFLFLFNLLLDQHQQ